MMGDTFYGGHMFTAREISGDKNASDEPLIPYQSLHAYRLSFTHPILEKPMTIEAPLPAQLQSIVDLLRTYRAWE